MFSVQGIVDHLFWRLQKLFRMGDATLNVFEAHGIDKAVANPLVHHEFHVQVNLSMGLTVSVQLIDNVFASYGAED